MALGSLRRFDVQARYALILSLASVLPFVAAASQAVTRYNSDLGRIHYGGKGQFAMGFLLCVGVSALFGLVGCLLGWNSAGQRRNDRQSASWIGFFVGGGVVTFDLILLIAFFMIRLVE